RGAARRRSELPLFAAGDRRGSCAVGVRACDCRLRADADEHGEGRRARLRDTLGVAGALDAVRARALRSRAGRGRHGAQARGAGRRVRRVESAARDRLGALGRLLRSRVLRATMSDADERPEPPTIESTRASLCAPNARGEMDPLHVARLFATEGDRMDLLMKEGAKLAPKDTAEGIAIFRAQVIGPLLTRAFT